MKPEFDVAVIGLHDGNTYGIKRNRGSYEGLS